MRPTAVRLQTPSLARSISILGLLLVVLGGCGWSAYPEVMSDPVEVATVAIIERPTVAIMVPEGTPVDSVVQARALMPFPCIGFVDETQAVSVDEVRAQVPCLITLLPWPQGAVPDPDSLMPSGDATAGTEPWAGLIAVTHANTCAWFAAWLDSWRSGDMAEAEAALPYLLDVLPNYGAVLPGAPAWLSDADSVAVVIEAGEAAASGDPALIEIYLDGSCA